MSLKLITVILFRCQLLIVCRLLNQFISWSYHGSSSRKAEELKWSVKKNQSQDPPFQSIKSTWSGSSNLRGACQISD